MSKSKDQLIRSAVHPFHDDAEMEMAASHLLGEMVPDDGAGADEAIARWDVVDARPRKPARTWVLAGATIAVVRDFHEVTRYVEWCGWVAGFPPMYPSRMHVS